MNLFQKIFGHKAADKKGQQTSVSDETRRKIEENTDKLWKLLEEMLIFYNNGSCQCAFPRYRQMVSLDCSDYHKSFYSSETEGLLHHSRPYFDMTNGDNKEEDNSQIWTCKKCGSVFEYACSGFSIYVNRGYLKIKEHKISDIGADAQMPIPFVVGLFGHSYPDRDLFKQVELNTFSEYMREMK